jgi:hypothetical protein
MSSSELRSGKLGKGTELEPEVDAGGSADTEGELFVGRVSCGKD